MRIVFVSDLHAAVQLPMARLDLGGTNSDRLRDVLDILRQIRDAKLTPDLVVIAGDLFDAKTPDGPTLVHTSRALRDLSDVCPVWLLPGNHDAIDRDGRMYSLQQFAELRVPNVRVLGHETVEVEPGVLLHAAPWLPDDRIMKRLRTRAGEADKDSHNILVCHQAFNGALWDSGMASTEGISPRDVDDLFPWSAVLTGHFHRPQTFGECGQYLGSPLDLRFGDEVVRQRGYTVITTGKKLVTERVATTYPRFDTIELNWDDIGDPESEDWASGLGDPLYQRIIVHGTAEQLLEVDEQIGEVVERQYRNGARAVKVDRRAVRVVEERRIDVTPTLSSRSMVERYAEKFAPAERQPLYIAAGVKLLDQ